MQGQGIDEFLLRTAESDKYLSCKLCICFESDVSNVSIPAIYQSH